MNAAPPAMARVNVVETDALHAFVNAHVRTPLMGIVLDDPHETSASTVASRKAVRAWFTSTIGVK